MDKKSWIGASECEYSDDYEYSRKSAQHHLYNTNVQIEMQNCNANCNANWNRRKIPLNTLLNG